MGLVMLLSCVVVRPADALPPVDALVVGGCFTDAGASGCGSVGVATATADVVVSPDGRHVYAAGGHDVQGFARSATGTLTRLAAPGGCVTDAATAAGCTATGTVVGDVTDLTISPDGATLYAAATDGIVILSRDPATGSLTPRGCIGTVQGCTGVDPSSGSSGLAVSPDGTSVYSRSTGRLLGFARNTSTGLLARFAGGCLAESLAPPACTSVSGLDGLSYQVAVSPDGDSVYVASVDGVAVFARNSTTGAVFQLVEGPQGGCVTYDGSSTEGGECEALGESGPALQDSSGVAVTPSGRHVIVSGAKGAVVFARDTADGTLTMTDCVYRDELAGCQHRPGVGGTGLSISPAGDSVVVAASGGHQWFAFDDDTGTLTAMPGAQGCWSGTGQQDCLVLPPHSGGFSQSAWSPDGTSVYTAGGSLAQLRVDRPPVCGDLSTSTTYDAAATVPASCTDPNGDEVSVSLASEPASGSASVDAGVIAYLPASGVTGTISFTYAGTAAGQTSAPAQVSVTVAAPPPPGVPPATAPPTPPTTSPVAPPVGPPAGDAPRTDAGVSIDIATSTIALRRSGRGKVVLACPATEVSGPCHGRVRLTTRKRFPFGGRNSLVRLAAQRYSTAAGASTTVKLALGDAELRLVEKQKSARKIWIRVTVLDSAGNRAAPSRKAKLLLR